MAISATQTDTKSIIMDTAERMIAERGIHGVSNRAILAEAGVNSAALHYHFNTREGLIEAILARSGRKTSLRRFEMIEEFDQSGRTPTAEDFANFIVDPMVELLEEEGEAGRRFLRFLARLQSDRTGIHHAKAREHFPKMRKRLRSFVSEICSGVPEDELELRVIMSLDTMLQTLSNADFMSKEWTSANDKSGLQEFANRLKAFLVGGLTAPPTKV